MLQALNSPAAAAAPAAATATTPAQDLTDTFLKLLMAQLKSQSPINPLDPNQFVTQLAQFDSLGALTTIQSLMQTLVTNTTPAKK
jgi:flagellar basal-body rod modification protein FlgD